MLPNQQPSGKGRFAKIMPAISNVANAIVHNVPKVRLGKPSTRQVQLKVDLSSIVSSIKRTLFTLSGLAWLLFSFLAIALIITGLMMLPLDKILKTFITWLKHDVGIWGPVILALAYIPLSILALPGSILTLGGGYVFGLVVGFLADSTGSVLGATAAFLVGKTVGRSFVTSKLKDYPQFQTLSSAISKSGFKIVLLLRLVPILPFNIMNYLLSVTPISITSFVFASWIGVLPSTFVFVYIGTTLKDISELGSTKSLGTMHWWIIGIGFLVTVVVCVLITRVAKEALQKVMDEESTNKEDDDDEMESNTSLIRSSNPNVEGTSISEKRPAPFLRTDPNSIVDQI